MKFLFIYTVTVSPDLMRGNFTGKMEWNPITWSEYKFSPQKRLICIYRIAHHYFIKVLIFTPKFYRFCNLIPSDPWKYQRSLLTKLHVIWDKKGRYFPNPNDKIPRPSFKLRNLGRVEDYSVILPITSVWIWCSQSPPLPRSPSLRLPLPFAASPPPTSPPARAPLPYGGLTSPWRLISAFRLFRRHSMDSLLVLLALETTALEWTPRRRNGPEIGRVIWLMTVILFLFPWLIRILPLFLLKRLRSACNVTQMFRSLINLFFKSDYIVLFVFVRLLPLCRLTLTCGWCFGSGYE